MTALAIVIIIMSATSRSRARLGVQGSRGESMFVDLRDRLRAFGELPELPGGWHAETAVEVRVRTVVLRGLRRGDPVPGRPVVRGRARRRVGQGRAGGHPVVAPLGCPRRSARRAGAEPVPHRGQQLPAPPELGRGVRHGGPRVDRPRYRRLHHRQRRTPAGGPVQQRLRALGSARRGGRALARCHRRRDLHPLVPPSWGGATRWCSTPTVSSSPGSATSRSGWTGCWARPSAWSAAGSPAERSGSAHPRAPERPTTAPS